MPDNKSRVTAARQAFPESKTVLALCIAIEQTCNPAAHRESRQNSLDYFH